VLVSGLNPFTNYTFYVLAVTVSPSESSENVTVLTDEAGNGLSKDAIEWYNTFLHLILNIWGTYPHITGYILMLCDKTVPIIQHTV